MSKARSLARMFFTNLINSLKPRQWGGTCVGEDYNGTRYFEQERNTNGRRIRPPRWFQPPKNRDFQQEIPPEWEAWLRYRRKYPPTSEEVLQNLQKMKMVQENVSRLEEDGRKKQPAGLTQDPKLTPTTTYPCYDDMEFNPGEKLPLSPSFRK